MSRKTQQRQTKKLLVIGDGKGNCANVQRFSGDGVVFSEARAEGSSGSYKLSLIYASAMGKSMHPILTSFGKSYKFSWMKFL